MLEIESNGNKIRVDEKNDGYVINFNISYDSDNDDTVSYALKNEESIEELDNIMSKINIAQVLTDDVNVELLVGTSSIGAKEVFFTLNDYANKENKVGTSKSYKINLNRELSNFEIFDSIIKLVDKDISMIKDEDYEYKPNSIKH